MTDFNPRVSVFDHARKTTPWPTPPSALVLLDCIRGGTYRKEVEAIRATKTKAERDELKKKIHAVTWSGTFTKRNAGSLDAYSQIICIDLDKLKDLPATKRRITDNAFTLACFISPSGDGLKMLFRVSTGENDHERAFAAIVLYLKQSYNLDVDLSGSDVCRLCFVSHDPELYYNPDALIVDEEFISKNPGAPPKSTPAAQPKMSIPASRDENDYAARCHEITIRTTQPGPGTYNAYINEFAIMANRYGVSPEDCAAAIAYYCGWPGADKDDRAVIKSVYAKFSGEHGQWLNKTMRTHRAPAPKARSTEAKSGKYNEDVRFWYVLKKADKNTGEVSEEYRYSYDDAIQFLENNGFFKYRFEGNKYQLIHLEGDSIVEIVTELQVKEFMIDYLKTSTSQEFKRVREMFRRGSKNYCSANILEGLEYYNPELRRDTATEAYIYFKNCFLEITAGGINPRPYSDLNGFIWKKQVIDFDFKIADYADCDFNRFLWYAITGRKCGEQERTEEERTMYNSVCSTIGYLLHRYKSPATTKAIIAVDKKIRRTGEANGRSGKSLFSKALGKMLNMAILDGPNFKFDYEFCFQQVNVDTHLINFNDVTKNFDFSRLFGMITEEFTFNKKKIDSITIPFADAPKFYISTNYTLKGDGESNRGRQQIIEFSTYFNSEHTPAKEFGRMFFYDWDVEEWCRYYSFMVHCVKLHLERGLIDFPLENYAENKLIDTAGEDFIDFMDETVMEQLQHAKEFDSAKLFEAYKNASRKTELKKNTFTKWVKMWADLHNLLLNAHKAGERDRRNGIDYFTFTENFDKDGLPF